MNTLMIFPCLLFSIMMVSLIEVNDGYSYVQPLKPDKIPLESPPDVLIKEGDGFFSKDTYLEVERYRDFEYAAGRTFGCGVEREPKSFPAGLLTEESLSEIKQWETEVGASLGISILEVNGKLREIGGFEIRNAVTKQTE